VSVLAGRTDELAPPLWAGIDWRTVETTVRRLQERIYRATERGERRKARSLRRLLVRASSAKRLAIRRVTQENRGKRTAGLDGVVCDTPEARAALFRAGLSLGGYKPLPVRRVYLPQSDGRRRPLGIPTVRDRVMQALVKQALEPEWECRFEANSYGFRPGRCTMDAIEALFRTLSQKGGADEQRHRTSIAPGRAVARRSSAPRQRGAIAAPYTPGVGERVPHQSLGYLTPLQFWEAYQRHPQAALAALPKPKHRRKEGVSGR
jgi:hypothetical protein